MAATRSTTRAGAHPYASALGAYLLGRIALLVAALCVAHAHRIGVEQVLGPWDGIYYEEIANVGYVGVDALYAFFPLFALLGHLGALVTSLTSPTVLLLVANLGGGAATCFGTGLVADRYGRDAGARAGIFFGLFPGAVVASLIYGDALAVALGLGALFALGRRRYLLAGVAAAGATAALSLLVVPVIAATTIEALRSRRRWALVAPLGALAGVSSYLGYLWARTGTPLTFERAEHAFWGVHLSWPWQPGTAFFDYAFATTPLALVTAASVACGALGLVVLVVRRAPASWTVWSVLVLAATTLDGGAWISPRFVFDAAPLVLATGAHLPRVLRPLVYLAGLAGLVGLLLAYSPSNRTFLNP